MANSTPQISIVDLSPISNLPEDHLLVILKAFFDGGNEPDSTQYDTATLASLVGTKSDWIFFENEWSTVRWKHKAPPLHTTDAVNLQNDFEGWNEGRRNSYLGDCVSVIEKSIVERGEPGELLGLVPCTITVVLKDFKYIQETVPESPQDASEILALQSLWRVLEWGEQYKHADFYQFHFDRNEPYRGHVVDRINNRRFRKQIPDVDLKRKIYSIGEANSSMVPALQGADLFAWCVSHKATASCDWHQRLLAIRRVDEWLDRHNLDKPDSLTSEFVKNANLPRRKPTR